ncbi:MAG: MFS transporter [Candidatus Rokuibacteriota bacterium]
MVRGLAAAGALVVSLDSVVNVAFPAMAAAFAVPPESMRWVIICYVGTYAVMAFVGGAAADRLGHAPVFRAGLALSAAAFILGACAPTFGWLLVARMVQGLGGGFVYGTAPGLGTLGVPAAARGRALGFINAGIGVGFTAGPLLAGLLIEVAGWRAIFWARVPCALAVLVWALALRVEGRAAKPRLVAAGDMPRGRVLRASILAFLANAGIFAVWLLAPFHLILSRGLSAGAASLLFVLTPLGTAVAALPAGRLADRVGARVPMALGLAIEAVGLGFLSGATATTPLAFTGAALFVAGFGVGFFQVPNMAAIMTEFSPSQQGAAGGVSFLARTLGIVAGVAVFAQLVAWRRGTVGFDRAFAEAFVGATVIVAAAALAAMPWRRYTRGRPI